MEREDETGVWMTEEKEAGGLKMNRGLDEYTVVKPERRKSHNNICISISFFPVFPETLWNPQGTDGEQPDRHLLVFSLCMLSTPYDRGKEKKENK